jgi:hypothetical protein
MSIRSRRELNTRDVENARNFEHWQTDGKYMTYNRPDLNAQAPFHEFLPINSRFDNRSYVSQPRFDAKGHRLAQNTYFDKYDPSYDSRNAVRELQAVVYEDKNVEGVKESNRLSARQFDNRWLNSTQQKILVDASVSLRPNMDDFTKVYRPL